MLQLSKTPDITVTVRFIKNDVATIDDDEDIDDENSEVVSLNLNGYRCGLKKSMFSKFIMYVRVQ